MKTVLRTRALLHSLTLTCLLISTGSLLAESNQLIEGFAKWQADRIERIAVDQALSDIAENTYVKKYFSQTSQAMEFYDTISGQRLIPLMQSYFQQDLNRFDQVTLCLKHQFKTHLNNPTDSDIQAVTKVFEDLQKLADGSEGEIYTTQNFLHDNCSDVNQSELTKSRFILTELDDKQVDNALKIRVKSNFSLDEEALRDALLQSFKDKVIPKEKADKVIFFAKRLIRLIEEIEQSMEVIESNDASIAYVQKAHHMLLIMDLVGNAAKELLGFEGFNIAKLNRLKNISLFLAGLADAAKQPNGADQVVAILNQYVDEQDTYNRKRHNTAYWGFTRQNDLMSEKPKKVTYFTSCYYYVFPCRDSLFLSSYYGLSMSYIDEQLNGEKSFKGRAYGPVGVELKMFNYHGSPVTIGYAPVDVGNYITAELRGDSYDAKTEDILSPSIFVSWSSASRPFSILVGYQEDIKIENGLKEDAAFIAFAFDLPIATIW